MGLMREAGLSVSIDAAGNICGRRAGSDSKLLPLVIGSHLDSVPQGGNYDGVVGSLGAIEVAQILSEGRLALRHPLEVLIFQNEEGGLQGSRAISGELREEDLNQTTRSGKTLREGIAFIGGDPAHLAAARRKPGDIFANLELHIEQGGTLATEKIDIGVTRAKYVAPGAQRDDLYPPHRGYQSFAGRVFAATGHCQRRECAPPIGSPARFAELVTGCGYQRCSSWPARFNEEQLRFPAG
jgi:acetylornithine deacetylase/succinyl-diaminopimelate desuccinylase-like protein